MSVERNEFSEVYERMPEAELQELARGYDSLTEAGQTAMRSEFARRGLEAPLVDEPEDEGARFLKLVTVRRYRDLSEAIVARSLLEGAGIVVYLFDENLIRLDWQLSNFIGGLRLQVEAGDVAAAEEILAQPVPEGIDFEGEEGADGEFANPHCPVCGSVNVTFESASRTAALPALLLFAVPLPPGQESWRCENCDSRWEDTESDFAEPADPV